MDGCFPKGQEMLESGTLFSGSWIPPLYHYVKIEKHLPTFWPPTNWLLLVLFHFNISHYNLVPSANLSTLLWIFLLISSIKIMNSTQHCNTDLCRASLWHWLIVYSQPDATPQSTHFTSYLSACFQPYHHFHISSFSP